MKLFFILLLFSALVSCQKKEDTIDFVTVKAGRETVTSELSLTGRVEAAKQAFVMAPDDLSVLELSVRNAEKVSEGTVLCKLDRTKVLELIHTADQAIEQNRSRLRALRIRLEGLRKDLEKSTRLFVLGAVSADEKDKVKQDYEILANDYETMVKEGESLQRNRGNLEKRASMLDLRSPFTGTVTFIWTNRDSFVPGSSVKKGDLLFKISSEGKMVTNITLREQDVTHFEKGQRFKLNFPALPKEIFEGFVTNVDTAATVDKDSGVATFKVTVEFDPRGKVRPGMEAQIQHVLEERKNVLSLPLSSVKFKAHDRGEVVLVKQNLKIVSEVKIGLVGEDYVEIISGIGEGQSVLATFESDL